MRNSYEGASSLINSEKMIYPDHLQGASPLLDSYSRGHQRSANVANKQVSERKNASGLAEGGQPQDQEE